MSHEVRLTLAANPEGARTAALHVRAMVSEVSDSDAVACKLSVAGATANVVRHAEAADEFTVIARAHRGRFLVVACHRSFGLWPSHAEMPPAEAESGRGLRSTRTLMARHLAAIAPLVSSVSHHPNDQESPS